MKFISIFIICLVQCAESGPVVTYTGTISGFANLIRTIPGANKLVVATGPTGYSNTVVSGLSTFGQSVPTATTKKPTTTTTTTTTTQPATITPKPTTGTTTTPPPATTTPAPTLGDLIEAWLEEFKNGPDIKRIEVKIKVMITVLIKVIQDGEPIPFERIEMCIKLFLEYVEKNPKCPCQDAKKSIEKVQSMLKEAKGGSATTATPTSDPAAATNDLELEFKKPEPDIKSIEVKIEVVLAAVIKAMEAREPIPFEGIEICIKLFLEYVEKNPKCPCQDAKKSIEKVQAKLKEAKGGSATTATPTSDPAAATNDLELEFKKPEPDIKSIEVKIEVVLAAVIKAMEAREPIPFEGIEICIKLFLEYVEKNPKCPCQDAKKSIEKVQAKLKEAKGGSATTATPTSDPAAATNDLELEFKKPEPDIKSIEVKIEVVLAVVIKAMEAREPIPFEGIEMCIQLFLEYAKKNPKCPCQDAMKSIEKVQSILKEAKEEVESSTESESTSTENESTSTESESTSTENESSSTESESTSSTGSESTSTESESTSTESESTSTESESTSTENESSSTDSESTSSTESESTSTENESTSTENESSSTESESTSSTGSESTSTESESTSTENESSSTESESTSSTESESTSTENESTSTENESTSTENESTSTESESTSTENESSSTESESTSSTGSESTSTESESTSTESESTSTENESSSTDSESTSSTGSESTSSTGSESTSTENESTSTESESTSTKGGKTCKKGGSTIDG